MRYAASRATQMLLVAPAPLMYLAVLAAGRRMRRARVAAVALLLGELAAEELHAEEGKDGVDKDHKDEKVLQLWDRVGECHADRVKPLPRLHEPQHPQKTQHAKDAQKREVGTAAAAHHP